MQTIIKYCKRLLKDNECNKSNVNKDCKVKKIFVRKEIKL